MHHGSAKELVKSVRERPRIRLYSQVPFTNDFRMIVTASLELGGKRRLVLGQVARAVGVKNLRHDVCRRIIPRSVHSRANGKSTGQESGTRRRADRIRRIKSKTREEAYTNADQA